MLVVVHGNVYILIKCRCRQRACSTRRSYGTLLTSIKIAVNSPIFKTYVCGRERNFSNILETLQYQIPV